jgi:hypothetical protein
MKRLFLTSLFLLFTCLYAYGDTEVVGLPGGGGISDGDDVTFGFGVFSTILDDATGDEAALTVKYETNKATSGIDYGIFLDYTDTNSPGTSYAFMFKKNGVVTFSVQSNGFMAALGGITAPKVEHPSNNAPLLLRSRPTFSTAGTGVRLQYGSTSSASTGQFNAVAIEQIYNQSGNAGYTDLFLNHSTIAEGSGDKYFIQAAENNDVRFSVDNHGSSDTGGAVAFSGISTATVDYTIGNFKDDPTWFIECDATLGNISTTLPLVADKKGRLLEVKLMSAANGCYLDGNGAETIDGITGQAITTQYNIISLIAGATEWLIR